MPNELKIDAVFEDPISSVVFSPESNQFLLASSWDSSIKLIDVGHNQVRQNFYHTNAVLDCCFLDANHIYSGGLDQVLKCFDLVANQERIVGSHDAPIRCVEHCSEDNVNLIVTGSWDQSIKLWDPRMQAAAKSYTQPGKVQTMSGCGEKLIVGTEKRQVIVWDLRNMDYVFQKRESSLKFLTKCIKAFPDKKGYVMSSIEGRVAVEYLDPSPEIQKKKYAFKCHRSKEDGTEEIYPVNTIAFHRQHGTFATGGSDCFVNMWDGANKKRLIQFHKYPSHITSLDFSHDGSSLAIACSNLTDFTEEGAIFIRSVTDAETKPK